MPSSSRVVSMTTIAVIACLFLSAGMAGARETEIQAFWNNLAVHCGQAFEGRRVVARDDRPDLLEGSERLIVHFRECTDALLALAFHIQKADGSWDRSRTWRFTWSEDHTALELRHDHRLPDGEPDESNTMYGGFSYDGTGDMQHFLFTERTAVDGSPLGWRIEIEPNVRYTYGTFRGDDWTWRLDFDLTGPLLEKPPPPWGFDASSSEHAECGEDATGR